MFATSYYHFTATDSKMQGWRHRNLPSPEADAFVEERTNRWSGAIEDARCLKILQALFVTSAFNPRFALSGRTIGRLTGLHHQIIRRLIRGDKHCRAKLIGLVSWMEGKGRWGTRYWLTPEGAKVAELLAKDFQVSKATLAALAADRWRRKMAHQMGMAHKNGTPSLDTMPSKDGFNNVCRLTPVTSKPSNSSGYPAETKPANGLAERLHRDFGVALRVANDLVDRYSHAEIEAAIALRERRNGAIWNGAGFIVYLLKNGYAQRYLQHKLRKTDPDLRAEEVKKALREHGVEIVDYGGVEYRIADRKGRLWRPIDPADLESTLRLAVKLGLIGCDSECESEAGDIFSEAEKTIDESVVIAETESSDDLESNFEGKGNSEQTSVSEITEIESSSGEDEEPFEPMELVCQRCGRGEGEHHPSLPLYAQNNLFPISKQNLKVRQVLGLGESGLICRSCIIEAYKVIFASEIREAGTEENGTGQGNKDDGYG